MCLPRAAETDSCRNISFCQSMFLHVQTSRTISKHQCSLVPIKMIMLLCGVMPNVNFFFPADLGVVDTMSYKMKYFSHLSGLSTLPVHIIGFLIG